MLGLIPHRARQCSSFTLDKYCYFFLIKVVVLSFVVTIR